MSEGDEQCHPTCTFGWSFSQTLSKDNHFCGNLHFPSIICFRIFLMTGTRIHVFFVSWYSWMFPNSFILVLLDFVWKCYHQLSAISLSFLIWSLYVSFGEVCFLLMLIEWSREVGVFCLELLSALLFFIVLLNCPFSFLYSVRLCLKISMFGSL